MASVLRRQDSGLGSPAWREYGGAGVRPKEKAGFQQAHRQGGLSGSVTRHPKIHPREQNKKENYKPESFMAAPILGWLRVRANQLQGLVCNVREMMAQPCASRDLKCDLQVEKTERKTSFCVCRLEGCQHKKRTQTKTVIAWWEGPWEKLLEMTNVSACIFNKGRKRLGVEMVTREGTRKVKSWLICFGEKKLNLDHAPS